MSNEHQVPGRFISGKWCPGDGPSFTLTVKRRDAGFEAEISTTVNRWPDEVRQLRIELQREVDDAVRQHRLKAAAEERETQRVAELEELDEQLELAIKQRDALVAKRTKNPTETSYDERIAAAQNTVDQLSAVRAANEQPITYNYER